MKCINCTNNYFYEGVCPYKDFFDNYPAENDEIDCDYFDDVLDFVDDIGGVK
jgi:hypothetical protein